MQSGENYISVYNITPLKLSNINLGKRRRVAFGPQEAISFACLFYSFKRRASIYKTADFWNVGIIASYVKIHERAVVNLCVGDRA